MPQAYKAGGGIGDEENNDDQRRHDGQDIPAVMEPGGEKLGQGHSTDGVGVPAQALGGEEPVEVSTHRQADHRPAHVRQTRQVGQAGQAHQQIAGHIAGLGTHGGDHGPQLSATQIEVRGGFALARTTVADVEHHAQID